MRIAAFRHSLLVSATVLASCNGPAIDPSQSLVGAKNLPPARILDRETIYIARGYDLRAPGRLAYELRPDDSLEVTFTGKNLSTVVAREAIKLDPDIASDVRRQLWRVRPEQLKGVQWDTMPTGCPRQPTDTFPEFTVAFIAEGPEPGVQDDSVGAFSLPLEIYCRTSQAIDARTVMQQVLHLLPSSKVAAEFDRRTHRTMVLVLQSPHPRHS